MQHVLRSGYRSPTSQGATGTAYQAEVASESATRLATATPISAIICTRDRPHMIGRAVESIAKQPYPDFEVLVVDQSSNGETQGVVEQLSFRYPRVRYLHLEEVGVSHAYNVGIRTTSSEILAFTDDDCIVSETWLADIARAFADDPSVALLYGQVLLPEELQKKEAIDGTTPHLPLTRRRHLNKREGFEIIGMGANFAARRTHWERLGGFDEILCAGGPLASTQDFDFAYRAFCGGDTILLEPAVVAYHYGFRTHAEWPATLRRYGLGDGAFYLKHIRCGDLYAAVLMLRHLGWATAHEAKRQIIRGPEAPQWGYVQHFLIGMLKSLGFGVDRKYRLYHPRTLA